MNELKKAKRAFFSYGRIRYEYDTIKDEIVQETSLELIERYEKRMEDLMHRMEVIFDFMDNL